MKFEYMILDIYAMHSRDVALIEKGQWVPLLEHLNEVGAQGWDFCGFFGESKPEYSKILFKRQIE